MCTINTPLTKQQVIDKLNQELPFKMSGKRIIVHVVDMDGNNFSPERYAYKVSYTCSVMNERKHITYYPNSVGIQGKSKLKGKLLK